MSHVDPDHTLDAISSAQDKQQVLAVMNDAGIGIKDFVVEKNLRGAEEFPESFPKELVQKFIEDHPILDTKFLYESNDDKNLIAFDLDDESDGTQALFGFAPWWIDLLKNDEILFVDEIDTSLHPLLVHHLVKLLHCSTSKAQLVFTTHDTTLLSQRMMRTDQVWFVEKDKAQSTQLYSLADYSPRPNEAIETRYLNGRYGAIPFLSTLDFYGE
jgi:AAA15 family ATPase/GTPase